MKSNIGVIGSGVMGLAISKNLAKKNFSVSLYDNDEKKLNEINNTNELIKIFKNINNYIESLEKPRKILLMVPAGDPVKECIKTLSEKLNEGDIIIDGGNSFYKDTEKNFKKLKSKKINFLGIGISGGEKGALEGPCIMCGGDEKVYKQVEEILKKISAQHENESCCAYAGNNSAGHFVKMIHNGIEYADMQIIAEVYIFLKNNLSKTNKEISEIFKNWGETPLKSYLLEITSKILLEKENDNSIIDLIEDIASNKGTGLWTSIESHKMQTNASVITASFDARVISNEIENRKKIKKNSEKISSNLSIEEIFDAYYLSKIVIYTQGFSMMQKANELYDYKINLKKISSIFRSGCIIQCKLLDLIMESFEKNNENLLISERFSKILKTNEQSLRNLVIELIKCKTPAPAFTNSLTYIDQLQAEELGANIIQGQRDFFGAHTFKRIDKKGDFHYEWEKN